MRGLILVIIIYVQNASRLRIICGFSFNFLLGLRTTRKSLPIKLGIIFTFFSLFPLFLEIIEVELSLDPKFGLNLKQIKLSLNRICLKTTEIKF